MDRGFNTMLNYKMKNKKIQVRFISTVYGKATVFLNGKIILRHINIYDLMNVIASISIRLQREVDEGHNIFLLTPKQEAKLLSMLDVRVKQNQHQ